jgi:acyl-CoA synthetase (AMP-forming)/AMP-acid ligase II
VAVDPRQTAAELQGLVGQVQPKLVVTDEELPGLFAQPGELDGPGPAGPDDPAVLIPTSGTTGRSKLVTQTQRAYAMAGEGFPWWLGLTAEDRLMTSLPLFPGEPRAAPPLLGERLPRLRPPLWRHRVQRDRRHARDPDAPA